ncbi:Required for respiratory growth protein 1, mitochondrial [Nakaseomyces bracarensis]|uniref:Required for respiratory growth protein 1, mitochondrial n=1 Tax=Nakaseomyces bracarensis TaxID=273131 RepID=A0ABR4NXY0_9SACH
MKSHFSVLEAHRCHVLTLYRHTLRNSHNVQSGYLKFRINRVLGEEVKKHKYDKSSWSIFKKLTSLKKLNDALEVNDCIEAHNLLVNYCGSIKKPRSKVKGILKSIEAEIKENHNIQDNRRLARLSLFDAYLKRKQQRNELPYNIPQEYKQKLLLPLALHERGLMNLERLKISLMKGKYHTKLSYTMSGKSRIWFVRSYVNKNKRESIKLRNLITQDKKKNLTILRHLDNLKENANWAMHEAIWERYLDDGHLHQSNINNYMKNMQFTESVRRQASYVPNTYVLNKDIKQCVRLKEWLLPLSQNIVDLENLCIKREQQFFVNKGNLLSKHGSLEYYKKQSQKVYSNHVLKYKKMLKEDLPTVNPFIENRSIPEILKKHGLKLKF